MSNRKYLMFVGILFHMHVGPPWYVITMVIENVYTFFIHFGTYMYSLSLEELPSRIALEIIGKLGFIKNRMHKIVDTFVYLLLISAVVYLLIYLNLTILIRESWISTWGTCIQFLFSKFFDNYICAF